MSNLQVVLVVYVSTAVVAVLGNAVAIVVLAAGKSCPQLKTFLINLALCDIFITVFSNPFNHNTFLSLLLPKEQFCSIVSALQVFASFVSVYTLVAIGINRYFAIIRCLQTFTFRPILSIVIIRCAAVALAAANYDNSYKKVQIGDFFYECQDTSFEKVQLKVFVFFVTYLVPFFVLVFVYTRMVRRILKKPDGKIEGLNGRLSSPGSLKKKIKAVRMLIAVLAAFLLFTIPLQLFKLLAVQPEDSAFGYQLYVGTYLVLHWLSMLHSCVNPFIYSFMSSNFRVGPCIRFRQMSRQCLKRLKYSFVLQSDLKELRRRLCLKLFGQSHLASRTPLSVISFSAATIQDSR